MTLKDKVVFVTGSNGIGESIAKLFAENGAIVYANARQPESFLQFLKLIMVMEKLFQFILI